MDGYSDLPFRSIARQLGSSMSYTEFINAMDVVHWHPNLEEKLQFLPAERPIVYQLFDEDPDRMLRAAQRLQAYQPDIIDINMGCSARSVAGRGAGAGLLRAPEKIARIFAEISRAVAVPVTGKIRLGWDSTTRNYLQVAKIIEENGGALIAVHGRTRDQKFDQQADWDAIAEVKQAVSIPVIANGGVQTTADIQRVLAVTGCDGVMIGRAAIGNPWIFSWLDRDQVSREQVRATLLMHLDAMQKFYGAEFGLIRFRKHALRYVSSYPLPLELKRSFVTCRQAEEFIPILDQILAQTPP